VARRDTPFFPIHPMNQLEYRSIQPSPATEEITGDKSMSNPIENQGHGIFTK
jgi:hypothetical protein